LKKCGYYLDVKQKKKKEKLEKTAPPLNVIKINKSGRIKGTNL
jgi:hypothetical protein